MLNKKKFDEYVALNATLDFDNDQDASIAKWEIGTKELFEANDKLWAKLSEYFESCDYSGTPPNYVDFLRYHDN